MKNTAKKAFPRIGKRLSYDALSMLFQFGIFLATALTAGVALIAIAINKKK